jgi:hypothetical protein
MIMLVWSLFDIKKAQREQIIRILYMDGQLNGNQLSVTSEIELEGNRMEKLPPKNCTDRC